MKLPKLTELIAELEPVTEIFLRDVSLFEPWYRMKQDSCDADTNACKKLFDEKRKQLFGELVKKRLAEEPAINPDEAAAEVAAGDPMICMRHNAPRNTAEHEKLGSIGCAYFFGGRQRKLDAKCFPHAPIWAGERITIRWSAKIVGPALLESRVFVNTSSVVKRSVICAGSQIEEHAVVCDSIVGRNVFIGPGVKLLHRRGISCEEIVIRDFRDIAEPRINTGRRKFGAVIGDNCVIGANSVLEPGTVLLPGTEVPPLTFMKAGIYGTEEARSGIPGMSGLAAGRMRC